MPQAKIDNFFSRIAILLLLLKISLKIGKIIFQEKNLKDRKIILLISGNRKTWARIPVQSRASFFPQKDCQIL